MTALIVLAVLACAGTASAQSVASASIGGLVRDTSGAPLPGAQVTATHQERHQSWIARADSAGRYRLAGLPLGPYRLEAVFDGFSPGVRQVTVAVGEHLDVPLTLAIAALREQVAVVAAPLAVELTRTQVSERVTPREIQTLPLNGRNYLDLALLAPGVSRTVTRNTERFAETSAVPGTGLSIAGQRNLNNTFLVDGLSANDDAAGLAGTYFSQEVIREFQVVTSGGVAELGRASAGALSIVTQSGTNDPHARGYAFGRDARFDARNAFATREDPLTHAQYGVTAGGPLRRGRTFLFANVEQTRQSRSGIVSIAPENAVSVNAALDAAGYSGPRVRVGSFETGYDTSNVFVRVDERRSPDHSVMLRYSFYDIESANARNVGGLNDASRGTALENRDQTIAVSSVRTFGAEAVNELRGHATRSRLQAPVNDAVGPAVNVLGVANLGIATFSPQARALDAYQLADTLTLVRGAHLVKAGADLLLNRLDILFPGALEGVYTFQSTAALRTGRYLTFQQAFGEPSQRQSNPNAGVFVQDEWRIHDGLTFTGGLRYDVQGLDGPIRTDLDNVSPRAGLAWAPGSRRTVYRASAGIYYDRVPLRAVSNALQRDGTRYRVAVLPFGQPGAPVFPSVLPAFPEGVLTSITTMHPELDASMTRQASVQVERHVRPGMSASATYLRLDGRNLLMSRNVNLPGAAGRPDPRFANINRFESIGRSRYDALTASMHAGGETASLRVSYTLSKAMDDAGNAFFSAPQDSNDVAADWGPSDNDQRHKLTMSVSLAWRAWLLSGLFSYASAPPFNVQTNVDRNSDTNLNDRPEGVGRNSARGFDAATLDVRVARRFRLARWHVEASLDVFNALNRTNFLIPNNIFGAGPAALPAFGRPTAAGDARQLQLGLRVGL